MAGRQKGSAVAAVVPEEGVVAEESADGRGAMSPSPRGSRRIVIMALAGLAVVAALAWVTTKVLYARGHETTDNAQIEGHILPVAPRVAGYVARVAVQDNQRVQTGDTLFALDSRDFEVRLAAALAEQSAARAAAQDNGTAAAGVASASAQRSAAEAGVIAAQAAFDRARRDYERFRDLAAKDIASKSRLDAAEAEYRSAEAALAAARDRTRSSTAEVSGARAQARTADARLAAADAAVEAARLQLSYTVVTATVSGRISKKNVEVGQYVQPGQPLMSVVDDEDVWIVANLKETQVGDVHPGQTVEIDVDAYDGHTFHGHVQSIQAATGAKFALLPPDNATGNFTKVVQRVPVKVVLDGSDGYALRPGMSVNVAIDTESDESPASHVAHQDGL